MDASFSIPRPEKGYKTRLSQYDNNSLLKAESSPSTYGALSIFLETTPAPPCTATAHMVAKSSTTGLVDGPYGGRCVPQDIRKPKEREMVIIVSHPCV